MPAAVRIGFAVLALAGFAAPAAAQPPAPAKGKLTVVVPQDNAELTIESTVTKAKGKTREFEVPALDPAREYEYVLKAVWRPNNYTVMTRTRTVKFKGGESPTVDLTAADPKDKAVVRYVPTPPDIAAKMVELAGVGKDDVAFEPGCGDARITVAAVKAGAKKGVGIDLDPQRVAEAKEIARKAGVGDRVEIRPGDALDIKDLSDATVVFLYMGNEFDALIRPNLWRQLKPGSRVVSHRFTMGDWQPDKTITVKGDDGEEYLLHLWTITEDVKKRAEVK